MARIRHPPLTESERLDAKLALAVLLGGLLTIAAITLIAVILTTGAPSCGTT